VLSVQRGAKYTLILYTYIRTISNSNTYSQATTGATTFHIENARKT